MILNLAVLHENTALKTNAIADDNIGTDDNIRANTTVLPNLGSRVNHNITTEHVGLRVWSQHLGVALRERRKIQASTA